MKTITRKSMLYQTGVEYGDYTMNHVQGCAHGCKYPCYAFLLKKRFGQIKDYDNWLEPYLVSNTLELLDKEIPRLRDRIQSVQLCFMTDPFMQGYPEVSAMSMAAIRKLNEAGIKCTALTKGLLPIELCRKAGGLTGTSWCRLPYMGEHRALSDTEHYRTGFARNFGGRVFHRPDYLRQNELQQNGKRLRRTQAFLQ